MFKKIYVIIVISLILLPGQSLAVTSLNDVSLQVSPKSIDDYAIWTINFTVPENLKLGHVLISFTGYQPDLSQARLSVSGLPQGNAQIGKTNPTCVSNCDDLRYIFSDLVDVQAGTKITFRLSDVKNPQQIGQTGIGYIDLYSSIFPATDLAYNTGSKTINLVENDNPAENEYLIPESVTSEIVQNIQDVMINELFYQTGSSSTKLSDIKDATKVEDFTLDLRGNVKITFTEPIDLSNEESVHYIANLADYMTFENLYFWVDYNLMSYFKVPLEITFYELPFVWEPDILKDDQFVLAEEDIQGFKSKIVDNKPEISFTITEAGSYRVVPRLVLYIEDNKKITDLSGQPPFSGRISDSTAILKISLNGKELKDLAPEIDPKTGDFSFQPQLEAGANLIEIQAESVYGQIGKVSKIVTYQPAGEENQASEEKFSLASISPLYFAIAGLMLLAVILIFTVRYLVKNK